MKTKDTENKTLQGYYCFRACYRLNDFKTKRFQEDRIRKRQRITDYPNFHCSECANMNMEMANGSRPRTTCDHFDWELSAASTPWKGSLLSQPNLGNNDHKLFVRSTILKARLLRKGPNFPSWKPKPAKRSLPRTAVLPKACFFLNHRLSKTHTWAIFSLQTRVVSTCLRITSDAAIAAWHVEQPRPTLHNLNYQVCEFSYLL